MEASPVVCHGWGGLIPNLLPSTHWRADLDVDPGRGLGAGRSQAERARFP